MAVIAAVDAAVDAAEDAMAAPDTDMAVVMAVAVVMAMALDAADMVPAMATATIMLIEALYAAALIIKHDYFDNHRNFNNFDRPANIYI